MISGALVEKLSEDMVLAQNGSLAQERKLYLYSAHDITIVALLKALKITIPEVPSFASSVIIELRKSDSGQFFVEVCHFEDISPGVCNIYKIIVALYRSSTGVAMKQRSCQN